MRLHRPSSRSTLFAALILAATLLLCAAGTAAAALERYDYDAIGRLVRAIDEASRLTTYTYDAAGNMLKVDTGGSGSALAPSITAITPSEIRRGESRSFTLSGQNLGIGELGAKGSGLSVSSVVRSDTSVSFTLAASDNAPLGASTIAFRSAAGSAEVGVTVNPSLPVVALEPTPLALPPDNVARQVRLTLSHADYIPHTVTLASSNHGVLALGVNVLTIPAGETMATFMVTGKAPGSAVLSVNSSTLAAAAIPVYVTGEFLGLSTSFARPLGVLVEETPAPPAGIGSHVTARPLRVTVGEHLGRMAPSRLVVGGQYTVTVSGAALPPDAAVSVSPAEGLTVGSAAVSADGQSLSFTVDVAADAPPIPRAVTISAGGQQLVWADPQSAVLRITRPLPELLSVEPFFATPGQTLTLRVRGKHLHEASALAFAPVAGLAPEAPQVSADGSELTARVQILPEAQAGARVLVVTTAAGDSETSANPANTFHVVNEIGSVYTPIAAPPLGVVLQEETPPEPPVSAQAHAPAVGVIHGATARQLAPKVAVIGRSTLVTITGVGLQDATALAVFPATGLTVGPLSVSADGTVASATVEVADDASQDLRAVQLHAGAAVIPFLSPAEAALRVSAPAPVLESVTPNVARTGASTSILVRGKDLHAAQAVRFEPATDAAFSNLQANAAGTTLTVTATVAAGVAPGPRALVITTNGGDSELAATPANTITLADELGATITPVMSAPLGVLFDTAPEQVAEPVQTMSAALGVVFEDDTPVPGVASSIAARGLGVVVGSAATGINPDGYNRSSSGILRIAGEGLSEVSLVSITPNAGVTLGTPVASADGKELSVPITVADDATAGAYQLRLSGPGGEVHFGDPSAAMIRIGLGTITLDSISPILAKQGELITLTLRGTNMRSATAVVAEPPEGIVFEAGGPQWSSDVFGDKLVIRLQLPADAALGPRVIRVESPGALSSGTPGPFNTLTVIAP